MVPRSWPTVDQRLGDGQGRLQVSRGPAARHQCVPPSARARARRRASFPSVTPGRVVAAGRPAWRADRSCSAMFIRMPMAARVITSDEPPKEMNGRGMPVTGSTPITAPMLMIAWLVIQVVTPTATRQPKRSGARTGGPVAVPGQGEEQAHDADGADQAELLPHHREDEVGVGVGQGPPLLAPAAESEAEQVAGAEADERLPHLVARARLVGAGIDERQDPVPPVGVAHGEHQRRRPRRRPAPWSAARARRRS